MKKFFTLIAVAVMAFAAQAATLTVCDAEETSTNVPIYGLYVDVDGTMGQMIYPAELLTDMVGAEITELTFYSPSINFSDATLQLGMAMTDKEDYEDYAAVEGATVLGSIVPNEGDTEMTFVFDEPFVYEGGNLMVQVLVTEAGDWATTYFYGENTPYYYSYYQYQSSWNPTPSKWNVAFLPKATFTYEAGEEPVDPEDPHMTGYWLVQINADGELLYTELFPGQNGDFVNVDDVTYPEFYEICGFYFLIDGVAYGAPEDMTLANLGDADQNPLVPGENTYYVGVGYSYTFGVHFIYDQDTMEFMGYSAYVAKGGRVDVDEVAASKTVAGVRYFNVAGQEMQEANGMTIVVTTYTDGTTSAVKVIK